MPLMNASEQKRLAERYLEEIRELATEPFTIMEVCGTHTVAIAKSGLRSLLPANVHLISGPGCPVCVTANSDIDRFLYLAAQPGIITATFGDMLRVPGSRQSLAGLRSEGADVRIVYSTLDALELARRHPAQEVVFLGVGFETTAPTVALAVEKAQAAGLANFSVLAMHKLVPPALRVLAEDPELHVDAFLDPGHACAVIGTIPIEFMASEYGKPGVVAGFEALDILEAILMLLRQRQEGRAAIEIQYARVVKREGNRAAQAAIARVFEPRDAVWRGIGAIPESGLGIRREFADWDAANKFSLPEFDAGEIPGCRCGDILRGRINPHACPLFASRCTPVQPIGPCMVSSEGTCAAYYRYAGPQR